MQWYSSTWKRSKVSSDDLWELYTLTRMHKKSFNRVLYGTLGFLNRILKNTVTDLCPVFTINY